jgi:hypothetical protein
MILLHITEASCVNNLHLSITAALAHHNALHAARGSKGREYKPVVQGCCLPEMSLPHRKHTCKQDTHSHCRRNAPDPSHCLQNLTYSEFVYTHCCCYCLPAYLQGNSTTHKCNSTNWTTYKECVGRPGMALILRQQRVCLHPSSGNSDVLDPSQTS